MHIPSYSKVFAIGKRGVTKGMPEWYKERLAKAAFDERKNNAD